MYSNALSASIEALAAALIKATSTPSASAELAQRRREEAQCLISAAADLAAAHGSYSLQQRLYDLSDTLVGRHVV